MSFSETDFHTVVIGAGVVGLAVGRALAGTGRDVCVLEASDAIGHGISSRNSEVIHAGIYYPKDSLKAKLCVAGRQMLYAYCKDRHISAKAVGKLIVATDQTETDTLIRLRARALANGVDDIALIDGKTAIAQQPHLYCAAALHSPSTGIVDSHNLMISLQGDIENAGGLVVCQSPVKEIVAQQSSFTLSIGAPSSAEVRSSEVINCAGLHAVDVAGRITATNLPATPEALFAKGNYFKLQGKAPFDTLIYPAPVSGGLGVHLTIDLAGQARFGPDVEWLDNDTPHNYQVDQTDLTFFMRRYESTGRHLKTTRCSRITRVYDQRSPAPQTL